VHFSYSSKFVKRFKKLSKKDQVRVEGRLRIFVEYEFDPILKNHKFHGEYAAYRSINITGDVRIVYRKLGKESHYLLALGTHSELFE
jgi:mRNA-degrading endonuclease YafQ of YafQ-DinJ toxin-antitoxin module